MFKLYVQFVTYYNQDKISFLRSPKRYVKKRTLSFEFLVKTSLCHTGASKIINHFPLFFFRIDLWFAAFSTNQGLGAEKYGRKVYLLKYYYKIIIKKKSWFKFSYDEIVVEESRASSANERHALSPIRRAQRTSSIKLLWTWFTLFIHRGNCQIFFN